jgi:sulfoxide reductase heme-binding subunit YedZ
MAGASGEWRRRVLRFHLPIAVSAALALVVFMSLPLFDPLAYIGMDMESRNALPRPMDMGSARPERPAEGDAMGHGGAAPSGDHGASQPPAASDHGAGQAPGQGHGGAPTAAPADHGAAQAVPSDPNATNARRAQSRFDQRLTVATGYIATGLLSFTLLIGPANLLLRRRNPVSSYLRRDAGMWTAAFSVVHVIVGLQVHSNGQISGFLTYFFGRDGSPLLNSFGLANWVGLAATVIVAGLLTISSDLALRTLRAGRWKLLQRLNYALFALVVAHAFFYGALLRMASPFTVMLSVSVIAVLTGQTVGIWLWHRRHAPKAAMTA